MEVWPFFPSEFNRSRRPITRDSPSVIGFGVHHGYHQQCHNPLISSSVLNVDVQWKCRPCVFTISPEKWYAKMKPRDCSLRNCLGEEVEFSYPTEEQVLDEKVVCEEEKLFHKDFFGGQLKSAEDYRKTRNLIYKQWLACKPNNLARSVVLSSFPNGKDISALNRIYSYLEKTGFINFECGVDTPVLKQTLPYDLNSLQWNKDHKTNKEGVYCYCGGPGDWFMKMLQCYRCLQWFHEVCIQSLSHPLIPGDRFYIYVCSVCNTGKEYLKRQRLKWKDLAHLALFALSLPSQQKYFDVYHHIYPWICRQWKQLQLGKTMSETPESERRTIVMDELTSNKETFQCGKEAKRKHTLFALRTRLPPQPPVAVVPAEGPLTDEVLQNLMISRVSDVEQGSPIPIKLRRRSSMEKIDQQLSPKDKDVGQKGMPLRSQDYKGYTGDPSRYSVDSNGNREKVCDLNGIADMIQTPSMTLQDPMSGIIPWLPNYSGINHPFKTDLECSTEIELAALKHQLLNSCTDDNTLEGNESDTCDSASNISSSSSYTYSESQANDNPMQKIRKQRSRKRRSDRRASDIAGRKSRLSLDSNNNQDIQNNGRFVCHQGRVVKDMGKKHAFPRQAKRKMCGYYIPPPEQFKVLSRRTRPNGSVQYLIQWEDSISELL